MQDTLDLRDPNMNGILDIYDLEVVITHLQDVGEGTKGGSSTVSEER